MKRVLLLYNPMAGIQEFNRMLDEIIAVFQAQDIELTIYRTQEQMDFYNYLNYQTAKRYQAILVAGGDGSISLAMNAMMKKKIDLPLGIIPSGTSNDFAHYLAISSDLHLAIQQLAQLRSKWIDLGKVNGTFFINVLGGGILPNVAQKVEGEAKNMWGKAAYYVTGLMEMTKNKSFRLRVQTEDQEFEEDYFLFLVMNGVSAGGFSKVGGKATAEDGKLNFVGIKSLNLSDVPMLFGKLLRGEHIEDPHVRYLEGEQFQMEFVSGDEDTKAVNIDGEKGPEYPLDIQVCKHRLQVLY